MKKLLKNLIVPIHKYSVSDLVRIGSGPEVFEIAARYYNENLDLVYILKTKDNRLFEEREEFVTIYKGTY